MGDVIEPCKMDTCWPAPVPVLPVEPIDNAEDLIRRTVDEIRLRISTCWSNALSTSAEVVACIQGMVCEACDACDGEADAILAAILANVNGVAAGVEEIIRVLGLGGGVPEPIPEPIPAPTPIPPAPGPAPGGCPPPVINIEGLTCPAPVVTCPAPVINVNPAVAPILVNVSPPVVHIDFHEGDLTITPQITIEPQQITVEPAPVTVLPIPTPGGGGGGVVPGPGSDLDVPIDTDQPIAMKFAPDDSDWKVAASTWAGEWLSTFLESESMSDLTATMTERIPTLSVEITEDDPE